MLGGSDLGPIYEMVHRGIGWIDRTPTFCWTATTRRTDVAELHKQFDGDAEPDIKHVERSDTTKYDDGKADVLVLQEKRNEFVSFSA